MIRVIELLGSDILCDPEEGAEVHDVINELGELHVDLTGGRHLSASFLVAMMGLRHDLVVTGLGDDEMAVLELVRRNAKVYAESRR